MRTNLAICLPFRGAKDGGERPGYVPPEWAVSLACLAPPMNSNYCYLSVKGLPRDEARNKLVAQALERQVRYVLFLDDDTAPPNTAIQKLMYELENADDEVAVCAGIYMTKSDPPAPVVLMEEGGGSYWRWKVGQVFECLGIGTGCMMIKASVFEKLEQPWFRDVKSLSEGRELGVVDEAPDLSRFEMTDDLYFCRKVRQAGFRILAHGGVLPVHWNDQGRYFVLPEGSYPVRGMAPMYANDIEGWMSQTELEYLHERAKQMESIVEVGSWKGRSTHALCSACPGTVTAVDNWGGMAEAPGRFTAEELEAARLEFLENMQGFANLKLIQKESREAARDFPACSVDMVFIDASHTYEEAKSDILAWLPKARKLICGHDYQASFPGVIQAVNEIFGPVTPCGSIWAVPIA